MESPDVPIVAVIGCIYMDIAFKTNGMLDAGKSTDCGSLTHQIGGRGARTAIAIRRATQRKPPDPTLALYEAYDTYEALVLINSALGMDGNGWSIRKTLQQCGTDVSNLRFIATEQTGSRAISKGSNTGTTSCLTYEGANREWKMSETFVHSLAGGRKPDLVVAHSDKYHEEIIRAVAVADSARVDTLLSVSPRISIVHLAGRSITHLVLNESEAVALAAVTLEKFRDGETRDLHARLWCEIGVKNVIIILDPGSAYYATDKRETGLVDVGEHAAQVVDSPGARDNFVGMYSAEYVRQKRHGNWNVRKAVERACRAAAWTVRQTRVQPIPWGDEIPHEY